VRVSAPVEPKPGRVWYRVEVRNTRSEPADVTVRVLERRPGSLAAPLESARVADFSGGIVAPRSARSALVSAPRSRALLVVNGPDGPVEMELAPR